MHIILSPHLFWTGKGVLISLSNPEEKPFWLDFKFLVGDPSQFRLNTSAVSN